MSYWCTSISDMDDGVVDITNSSVVCAKGCFKYSYIYKTDNNNYIKSEYINNSINSEY